jgi:hypothetical protein
MTHIFIVKYAHRPDVLIDSIERRRIIRQVERMSISPIILYRSRLYGYAKQEASFCFRPAATRAMLGDLLATLFIHLYNRFPPL